jgi:hypothetical protein
VVEVDGIESSWEAYTEDGGREICIRLHISPTAQDKVKLQISIIPLAVEEVVKLGCVPSDIPSFLIHTKEIQISPKTATPWGLAFLPLFVLGDPSKPPGEINQDEVRSAIHGVFKGCLVTKFYTKTATFQRRLEKVLAGEVSTPKPAGLWPAPLEVENTSGRHNFI